MGFEPTPSAWKAEMLPLNTNGTNTRQNSYYAALPISLPQHGAGGWIRTNMHGCLKPKLNIAVSAFKSKWRSDGELNSGP